MSAPWLRPTHPDGFPRHLSQEQEALVRCGGARITAPGARIDAMTAFVAFRRGAAHGREDAAELRLSASRALIAEGLRRAGLIMAREVA